MNNKIWIKAALVPMFVLLVNPMVQGSIDRNSKTMSTITLFDELDQSQTMDNFGSLVYMGYDRAQSFTPTLDCLTKIEVKLEKIESPGDFMVYIRKDLEGSNLITMTKNQEDIPEDKSWIIFDFEDISVTSGDTYYIVCSSEGGVIFDMYYWRGSNENPYPNGMSFWYDAIGGNWVEDHQIDFCFKTYGTPPNEPPNKPMIPSGPTSGDIGTTYTYSSLANDPNTDDTLQYLFDWGDLSDSGWIGPYNVGDPASASHQWSEEGIYKIKVKAKDSSGEESPWSDELPINMPKTKKVELQQYALFVKYHELFQLIQRILTIPS